MEVSWLLTGIRQDPYAEATGFRWKKQPVAERGGYLYPELYGQPREKGIQYANQTRKSPAQTSAGQQ